jgi:hypothetical protein
MKRILTVLAVLAFAPLSRAEEIDNPSFKSWAKHKVGTTVTMKTVSDVAGQKTEAVMTSKLVELTADKAVVEMTVTTKVAGMEFTTPATKMENPKKIKVEGKKPEAAGKPEGVVKEGEETVKVGGKEYKAKFYETKTKTPSGDVEGKIWMSDEVPGGMLKMESKLSGAVAGTTTMEVTEIKTP